MANKYRTYKNLFRVKAEISSIGDGPMRFRLPEGVAINMDMVFVFVATLPISRFLVAPIFEMMLRTQGDLASVLRWVYAIFISAGIAYVSRKFEPAGKSVMQYVWSIITFLFRNKWHDGWEAKKVNLYKGPASEIRAYLLSEQDSCGSSPAVGFVDAFELKVPSSVKVSRSKVIVSKIGKKLSPGVYRIQKGKVIKFESAVSKISHSNLPPAPAVKRKRKEDISL